MIEAVGQNLAIFERYAAHDVGALRALGSEAFYASVVRDDADFVAEVDPLLLYILLQPLAELDHTQIKHIHLLNPTWEQLARFIQQELLHAAAVPDLALDLDQPLPQVLILNHIQLPYLRVLHLIKNAKIEVNPLFFTFLNKLLPHAAVGVSRNVPDLANYLSYKRLHLESDLVPVGVVGEHYQRGFEGPAHRRHEHGMEVDRVDLFLVVQGLSAAVFVQGRVDQLRFQLLGLRQRVRVGHARLQRKFIGGVVVERVGVSNQRDLKVVHGARGRIVQPHL